MHEFDPYGLILQCRRRQQRRDNLILRSLRAECSLAALAGAASIPQPDRGKPVGTRRGYAYAKGQHAVGCKALKKELEQSGKK